MKAWKRIVTVLLITVVVLTAIFLAGALMSISGILITICAKLVCGSRFLEHGSVGEIL